MVLTLKATLIRRPYAIDKWEAVFESIQTRYLKIFTPSFRTPWTLTMITSTSSSSHELRTAASDSRLITRMAASMT